MTENAPQVRELRMVSQEWGQLKDKAVTFIKSGLAPASIRTPEQAMIIAAQGKELGVPFMASMRAINVIQNRPALSAQLKLALAMQTGELEDFKVEPKPDGVLAHVKRKGRVSYITSHFGVKEATAMKLIGKDNYEKQPMTMFQWRALGMALDIAFADVILGMRPNVTPLNDEEADAILPTAPAEEVIDTPQVFDQPTAAQEEVAALQEHKEAQAEVQSGGTSEEMINLMADIKDKLASLCKGDLVSMNQKLKELTTYTPKGTTDQKWLQLADLPKVAKGRPQWILGIHKKVKAEFEKEFGTPAAS